MSSEPIFVLVPGFWHPGKCYQQLIDQVQQRGYDALALDNPSSGLTKPESKTVLDDAQNARSTIVKLIDQGRDVVVITHSYGGAPGGIAAQGLSKKDRQLAGKTGGVVGLVYMAAFPVKEGHFTGGTPAPFVQLNQPWEGVCTCDSEVEVLFGDVEIEYASELVKMLQPQSLQTFNVPDNAPAWLDEGFQGKLGYIRCLQDKAIPPAVQEMLVKGTEKEWIVVEMETSHSPFASKPAETAQHCIDFLVKFSQ